MDMSGSDSMSSMSNSTSSSSTMDMSSSMMMKMYLHFTPGDMLFFDTIVPTSAGAVFGACLIFFVISIFHRWLRAFRRGVEMKYATRAQRLALTNTEDERTESFDQHSTSKGHQGIMGHTAHPPSPRRVILSQDIGRGLFTGVEEILHYLLMLVVMTFNASYIISIILGAVVGEMAFGGLNCA